MTSDKIQLNDLEVACVIGLNAEERVATQNVYVSTELELDTRAAAETDHLAYTVDYEFVATEIRFLLQAGQFFLLETACHALCHTLLLPPLAGENRPLIGQVKLRLCKPQGLSGNAYPSVQIVRSRNDVTFETHPRPFGSTEVIFETPHVGIYRTVISPGKATSPDSQQVKAASAMLLTDGFEVDGCRSLRGSIRPSPRCMVERYRNDTEMDQALLTVLSPPVHTETFALCSAV